MVSALDSGTLRCSWAKHYTYSVPRPLFLGTGEFHTGLVQQWNSLPSRGRVKVFLVASR